MSSINTNVTAMAAIRSLTMINNNMQTTQARVESGLRINKANDDPAVFSIAQGMRADLKGLTAVTDGLAFGKATLTVARDAATKISNELNTLKQTITQGQQQGLDKATMNAQVQNLLNNMRSFAETATFNGVNLLNNSASGDRELRVLRDITGNTINVANQEIISDTLSGSRLLNLDNLDVDQGGLRLSFGPTVNPADGDFVLIRTGSGTSAREFVFEFNRQTDDTDTENVDERQLTTPAGANRTVIEVSIGDTGSELTPTNELGRLVDAMKAAGFGARVNDDGTIDIFGADVSGIALKITGNGAEVGESDTDSDPLTQGTFIGLERSGSGTNTTWTAREYNLSTGVFSAVVDPDVSGPITLDQRRDAIVQRISVIGAEVAFPGQFSNASSAIATVDEAIRLVNQKVAELGARLSQVEGQQEFTKQLTDSIKEGLGALVDADLAEESARLTSLQTKQQLAIQSLSIANQQGQALLGLFR
jgi:flagellin